MEIIDKLAKVSSNESQRFGYISEIQGISEITIICKTTSLIGKKLLKFAKEYSNYTSVTNLEKWWMRWGLYMLPFNIKQKVLDVLKEILTMEKLNNLK